MLRRHPLVSALTGVYVVALFWITLTPAPFGGARTALMAQFARVLARSEITSWITLAGLEIAGNVLLFLPFGLLVLSLVGRRRWLGVLFAAFLASCWIELAQSVWLPMLAANPIYVVAHVGGAAIGILLAVALVRREPASRRVEPATVGNH